MLELRTYRVGGGGWLVAVRGLIDRRSMPDVAQELARHDAPIVDLLGAELGDPDHLRAMVAAAGPGATFVAEARVADELVQRVGAGRLFASLASALA